MEVIEKIIASIVALILVVFVLGSVLAPAFLSQENLDNTTFTANATLYNLNHGGVDLSQPTKLYYFDNTTFQIPASKVVFTSSQVKIYTNQTNISRGDYPNITAGYNYYASYKYQTPMDIGGVSYLWVFGLMVIVVIFAIILHFKNLLTTKGGK